jgi:VanZ family protein
VKPKFVAFIPAIAWFVFITVLLLLPGNDLPESNFFEIIYFDKWVHIGFFSVFVFLFGLPYSRVNKATKKVLIKIVIAGIVYGVLIEFAQKYLTTQRSFDVTDMVADTIGCLAGWLGLNWYTRKVIQKNKPL